MRFALIVVPTDNIDVIQRIEGFAAWRGGFEASLDAAHPFRNAPPPGPAGILDRITATASRAYQTERLTRTYTGPLIRVRRSTDSAELDIGFNPITGALDTATLLTFCGAGDGHIVTFYDQSPSAQHATNPIASQQPRIVIGGVLQTAGGKPVIDFDGVDDRLPTGWSPTAEASMYVDIVTRVPPTGNNVVVGGWTTFNVNNFYANVSSGSLLIWATGSGSTPSLNVASAGLVGNRTRYLGVHGTLRKFFYNGIKHTENASASSPVGCPAVVIGASTTPSISTVANRFAGLIMFESALSDADAIALTAP
jgi:hypothetical protein